MEPLLPFQDNDSVTAGLRGRVEQLELAQDSDQVMLRDLKEQNELLEFQLLEMQEEVNWTTVKLYTPMTIAPVGHPWRMGQFMVFLTVY